MKLKLKIFILLYVCEFNQIVPQSTYTVYLIKTAWHVGISVKVDSFAVRKLKVLDYFKEYKFADIGWGDEQFYQEPGTDILLALKALFLPTPSVVRIAGIKSGIKDFISASDFTVNVILTKEQYAKLLEFIEKSLAKNAEGKYLITSREYGGEIMFFKSGLKYHMFHTCNTWIAGALNSAGIQIETHGIITAAQLYRELIKTGEVIKPAG